MTLGGISRGAVMSLFIGKVYGLTPSHIQKQGPTTLIFLAVLSMLGFELHSGSASLRVSGIAI